MLKLRDIKIFGQDPAFIVSTVEAGLAMLLAFGVVHWDQSTVGLVMAAVTATLGLVVAYATTTTIYSAFMGFAKALMMLGVTFLHVSNAENAAIMAFLTLVAGAFLRQTTNSMDTPLSNASPGAKKEALQLYALQAAVQEERAA